MIRGKIEGGLHPKILVEVKGKIAHQTFSALVDTGFDLFVALHRQEAAKLGLEIDHFTWVRYANGEREKESVCPARVLWHGKWKDIEVILSNDEEPAVGTGLLQGSVVTMDFVKNKISIREATTAKRRKN